MTENLQDELYQLENKQAKSAKLGANYRQQVDGEKCSKTSKYLVHVIGAKLVSTWEQNMLYNGSQQVFVEKRCLC